MNDRWKNNYASQTINIRLDIWARFKSRKYYLSKFVFMLTKLINFSAKSVSIFIIWTVFQEFFSLDYSERRKRKFNFHCTIVVHFDQHLGAAYSKCWLNIGSSSPIYTRIHFIHISLAECYYTFNYKDNWNPGLFPCYTLLYNIFKWCCISWPAIGCSGARHTHISNHYTFESSPSKLELKWIFNKFFIIGTCLS